MTDDDYPAAALRLGQQGVAKITIQIDSKGKPKGCRIIESSGSASLDEASCAMFSKLRFKPAQRENGKSVEGEFVRNVSWNLPGR
ncbi:TonB family protein [Sphingobium sp. B1D7B]|uniref:energy transducer TonB n=1 Tax=unclassified Sphingobium TaxID=2611147 RepID=UPI002224B083|nr:MULTISPECIES: energy transducer TonB [unclassified Sphingobium]MCW2393067.1 TonB family protein [Sphingobium sp. B11D3A]MCW2404870.1 TonB family protein [Sphingobium sp. B1D7B]